ncbi:hypothetical protein Skr01_51230 [Sphaerisporangium krabiense]|uniref:Uncharacterized protein n=1 Tax=Sphaerisporangium krabiense TaxID=763782 RepID=A0A7W8Z9T3_9ACTN|nr:hypothetical protein [Sphaerisporangium krabiense]GII65038.1 hypothetical protein Skr01_51230 [Sphaerisporangium krabiense]
MRLARTAAIAMRRDISPADDFLRTFGPLTVAMKRAENAMVNDHPDLVLRMSQTILTGALAPTSILFCPRQRPCRQRSRSPRPAL